MLIKKRFLESFLILFFVLLVGFDSSTNFLFKDNRIIFSYGKEIVLWSLVLLVIFKTKLNNQYFNLFFIYIILSIISSTFYGLIFTYYFFSSSGYNNCSKKILYNSSKYLFYGSINNYFIFSNLLLY